VQAFGKPAVVGGYQERLPEFPVRLFKLFEQGIAISPVEVSGGFIGENERRVVEECPGECHTLTFAPRKLRWQVGFVPVQSECFEKFFAPLAALGPILPFDKSGKNGVFERCKIGKKVVKLKDEADVLVAECGKSSGIESFKRQAGNRNTSFIEGIESSQDLQQGGFAGTAHTDQRDHLAPFDGEIRIAEHRELTLIVSETFTEIFDHNDIVGHVFSLVEERD
jgi:hypothetical protein